jgi:hypothetical protein
MTKAYFGVKSIAGEILKMPVGVVFTSFTIQSSKCVPLLPFGVCVYGS